MSQCNPKSISLCCDVGGAEAELACKKVGVCVDPVPVKYCLSVCLL